MEQGVLRTISASGSHTRMRAGLRSALRMS